MRDVSPVRPDAGRRDPVFAAAMHRAEAAANFEPVEADDPLGAVARTRTGFVVRRNGERFMPGPLLDASTLPLVD